MMVPKSFRLQDWLAEAFHDSAVEDGLQDGELLRRLITKHLEDKGYKLSDYMFKADNRTNR